MSNAERRLKNVEVGWNLRLADFLVLFLACLPQAGLLSLASKASCHLLLFLMSNAERRLKNVEVGWNLRPADFLVLCLASCILLLKRLAT
jgi:hypothetical protein